MLLLPVQPLFLACWKERENIAFADKCHVVMNQQQDLLSAVFKTLCCNQPTNNRPLWSHFYTNLSVHPLWQCLLSHFSPDRREAVLLPPLQQGFRRQVQSQGSPTDPFGCEKIPMQELLQNLLQNVSSAQAWGIWLLCSTLNWDTFPPPDQRKKNCFCFFSPPHPHPHIQENCQGITWRGFVSKTFDLIWFSAAHFISEWDNALSSRASCFKQCFCDCNQCRASSYLPVLFMHFSACLECVICFHDVISSVCTNVSHWLLYSPPLFWYKPHQ